MALIISRRLGEGLMVGDAMIRAVQDSHGKLRLSVEAPKNVPVTREELLVTGPDGTMTHPDFFLSRLT